MPSLRLLAALALAGRLVAPIPPAADDPPPVVGGVFQYVVQPGDSLTLVSATFGMELAALARRNGLAIDAHLKIGQRLTVDNRHIVPATDVQVVINLPQRMLFARTRDGRLVAQPVAVGRPTWPTPIGDFTVNAKEVDPVWDVPESIQEESRRAGKPVLTKVPPGPDNPLGKFWLALSLPGIGIHGTNDPASVFAFATHGCVRVGPAGILELFTEIAVGASGRIIYEPALLTVLEGRVLVEVHRDRYRHHPDGIGHLNDEATRLGVNHRLDRDALERAWTAASGVIVDVTQP